MNHSEAVEQMAAEQYLLDELTPELREAFEEHMFDCPECAFDVRAEAAFLSEAKAQLPDMPASSAAPSSPVPPRKNGKKVDWFFWRQPAFAVPAFALLVAVVGYQNLATIPALRSEIGEPRVMPWTFLHAGTRGAAEAIVQADRKQGAVLLIDLPQNSAYTSYAFSLYDAQNKQFWTQTVASSGANSGEEKTFSLLIPGSGLQQASYTLAIAGVTSQGERTEIDRRVLAIHFGD